MRGKTKEMNIDEHSYNYAQRESNTSEKSRLAKSIILRAVSNEFS